MTLSAIDISGKIKTEAALIAADSKYPCELISGA